MRYKNLQVKERDGVYEPGEDSLLLAEAVDRYAYGKVLDLGTGSGIQGIVAAKKGCNVTFADIDPNALNCAAENAKANGVKGEFLNSDMFSSLRGKFDTIIFNPPYLPSAALSRTRKRHYALDGGLRGREFIDKFLKEYKNFLNENGAALLIESGLNNYESDVTEQGAMIVAKTHYFFEDIVVLLLH